MPDLTLAATRRWCNGGATVVRLWREGGATVSLSNDRVAAAGETLVRWAAPAPTGAPAHGASQARTGARPSAPRAAARMRGKTLCGCGCWRRACRGRNRYRAASESRAPECGTPERSRTRLWRIWARQRRWRPDADCVRGLLVHHQFERCRLLHQKIARFGATPQRMRSTSLAAMCAGAGTAVPLMGSGGGAMPVHWRSVGTGNRFWMAKTASF